MRVDLYQSALKRDKILAVPAGTDISAWPMPTGFDPDLKQVNPLRNTIDLEPNDNRIGMNPADVLDQIAAKGWALVQITITVTVGRA